MKSMVRKKKLKNLKSKIHTQIQTAPILIDVLCTFKELQTK